MYQSPLLRDLHERDLIVQLTGAPVAAGLDKSKSEARTFIQDSSVSVNGEKRDAIDHRIAGTECLFGRFTLLRRGKKQYAMIRWR
ncbi:MAG: S4 domain-containing protein [Betaproteobacteria bacterium]|nr:S4 domain-containing protein [Betaproteobacteria bacterium]